MDYRLTICVATVGVYALTIWKLLLFKRMLLEEMGERSILKRAIVHKGILTMRRTRIRHLEQISGCVERVGGIAVAFVLRLDSGSPLEQGEEDP
jgi:hypothetical protein